MIPFQFLLLAHKPVKRAASHFFIFMPLSYGYHRAAQAVGQAVFGRPRDVRIGSVQLAVIQNQVAARPGLRKTALHNGELIPQAGIVAFEMDESLDDGHGLHGASARCPFGKRQDHRNLYLRLYQARIEIKIVCQQSADVAGETFALCYRAQMFHGFPAKSLPLAGKKIRPQHLPKLNSLQKKRSMADVRYDSCKTVRIYEGSNTRDAKLVQYLGFLQQSHAVRDSFSNIV